MSNKSNLNLNRPELMQQIDWSLRELSTSTVLAATSIAQKVNMGPNDFKCAELLVRNGAMTAGQLAKAAGLTTGAITGIVDRLEKAGWARREDDPQDRRRVMIYPGPQNNQKTANDLYKSHQEMIDRLFSEYSDDQLLFILQFVRRLTTINYEGANKPSEFPGQRS